MDICELQNCRILVVGDVIVDDFIYTTASPASRLSPEAPVPVVGFLYNEQRLGGACNVAANLKALGCHVCVCGLLGDDKYAEICSHLLSKCGVVSLLVETDNPTISKTRIICDSQHIVRLDREERFDEKYSLLLQSRIKDLDGTYDAIIVSDYDKGTISEPLMSFLKNNFSESLILVDPKPTYSNNKIDLYQGVTCITPNLSEAKIMSKVDCPIKMAESIHSLLNCKYVVVTTSEKGAVVRCNNKTVEIPAHSISFDDISRPQRRDVTGAGDTLIATLAASLCAEFSIEESMFISNVAAAIVVNKMGTETCSLSELQKEVNYKE